MKSVAIFALKRFFGRIIIKNSRNIPEKGPIIFAGNHPNTLMDPMLIGYSCKRDPYFLAKSTLFKSRFKNYLMSKMHAIPVYRKMDKGTDTSKNLDTFEKCYEHLEKNGSLLIFPEGVSTGERKINPVKTGVARIALEAEKRNNFNLGLTIIPVGLNYSNLSKFRSDAYVRYGHPIQISDYKNDFIEDEYSTVHEITHLVETALSKLTTTLKDLEMEEIVSSLEKIYKSTLITDLGYDIKDSNDEFSVTKGLINAVEWYFENDPERTKVFKKHLDNYLNGLNQLEIMDETLAPEKEKFSTIKRIGALLVIILGFPVYLFGLINNYLPYKFPRWYTNKYIRDITVYAPVKMIAGGSVFLLYYLVLLIPIQLIVQNLWITAGYALLLVPSGNYVLWYLKYVKRYRQHFRFIRLFYKERDMVYQLINQRVALVEFLDQAKNDYLKAIGLKQTPL